MDQPDGGGTSGAPGASSPPQRDEPDDRTLLRRHLEGDPESFGRLFTRHRDRLWAVALRTTGDPEEAADALQDALVSAFRKADTYRGDAAVTTWLHRIVVNACLDRLRRRQTRATAPLPDDLDTAVADLPDGDRSALVDPADVAVDGELRRAVLAALAALPPEQRAAVVLVDMEGYSVEETAAFLDCAPGTVKSRCARARAKLLPLLAEHRATRARQPGQLGPPGNHAGAPRVAPGRDGHDRHEPRGGEGP
jgi:RNA polymerase sigma-70 factor (ECF subfamily)